MSRRDDSTRMKHMLEYAREAVTLVRARTRADLETDRLLYLGLLRLVEVIGEAASQVSRERCAMHPAIPWKDLIAMRNKLIHGYDRVDPNILWDTVTDDLPSLVQEIERALQSGNQP